MTRAQYKKKLIQNGIEVQDDQDIFHIIAESNGGANHPDNYHFAQNRFFNRAIGNKFDIVNAYMAGLQKTEKAIACSPNYKGPYSALEMYKAGEAFWKDKQKKDK